MNETFCFCVPLMDKGGRLDTWLHRQLPHLSRTRIKSLMEQGQVKVNSIPGQPSQKVKAEDQITLVVPEVRPDYPEAQTIPLEIIFEDNDVLVLNKPPGLVVHPSPGHRQGTLVNALLSYCPQSLSGIGGVKRPGIVHRLDKGTSGLMIVAKNDFSHQALSLQFADRTLSRSYQAIVGGILSPATGCVETLIGRHPYQRQKMAVVSHGGKEAITYYKVEETFGTHASLVKCTLKTGRTHQIRVHLNHLGHGILGDPVYGFSLKKAPLLLKEAMETLKSQERPLLHAYELKFFHPRLEKHFSFMVPQPDDFKAIVALLSSL